METFFFLLQFHRFTTCTFKYHLVQDDTMDFKTNFMHSRFDKHSLGAETLLGSPVLTPLWHFFKPLTDANHTEWQSLSNQVFSNSSCIPWNKIEFNALSKATLLKLATHFLDTTAHNYLCLSTDVTLDSSPNCFSLSAILPALKTVTHWWCC